MKKILKTMASVLAGSIFVLNIGAVPIISYASDEAEYYFKVDFTSEDTGNYVDDVNAKIVQYAIDWTDDEHYTRSDIGNVVCEWNSTEDNPFTSDVFTDSWHDYVYTIVVDELPNGYSYNSDKSIEYGVSGYLSGEKSISIQLDEEEVTETKTPLSGTYSLKLNVMDIVKNASVENLDCELLNYQTGEVIATWNTSDKEVLTIDNLEYSFNEDGSSNIIYAIKITNLPDGYVFFYGKSTDVYAVSGTGLEEFANGTDVETTVYLEDSSDDADYHYVTSTADDLTNNTTETTTVATNNHVIAGTKITEATTSETTNTTFVYTTDENGNYIDENGNILETTTTTTTTTEFTGNMTTMYNPTTTGTTVAQSPITTDENGNYIDENGNILETTTTTTTTTEPTTNMTTMYNPTTTETTVAKSPITTDENGNYIDEDGNIIDILVTTLTTAPSDSTTTTTTTTNENTDDLPQTGMPWAKAAEGLAVVLTVGGAIVALKSRKK